MIPDLSVADVENISVMDLRERGDAKWTRNPGALGASVAEMDFGIAPPISEALTRAVTEGPYGYMPQALDQEVAVALTQMLEDDVGWRPEPELIKNMGDILIGMEAALVMSTERGAPVTVMTPAYMPFLSAPRRVGRKILESPLRNTGSGWAVDWETLEDTFRRGSRFLILCNPHNPLGKIYTRDELTQIARLADKYSVRVFVDEVHALIRFDGAQHIPFASLPEDSAQRCITATSASKAWNVAGLKCAQIIFSRQEDLKELEQLPRSMTRGASTFGALATLVAYRAGGPWLDQVRRLLAENRRFVHQFVEESLPGVTAYLPDATYLTWLDCRELGWGPSPSRFFLEAGNVALSDGALCGAAGEGYARLNFATPKHILEEILAGLKRTVRS